MRPSVAASFLLLVLSTSACSTVRSWLPGDIGSRKGPIKRVAVLPFAYRASSSSRPCDLCPDRLVMAVTSEQDALLATGFLYEGLARYPRIQVIPYERIRELQGATMRETLANVVAKEQVDTAIVGALLELRPRIGDPRDPRQRGGAAVYAVALDLPSGDAIWKRYYDRSPGRPGRVVHTYDKIVGVEERALTDQEATAAEISDMVPSLVKALR